MRLQALQAEIDAMRSSAAYGTPLIDESAQAGRGNAIYMPQKIASTPILDLSAPTTPNLLKESQLEISGFLDGVYTANPRDGKENQAALNQIELDLARSLNDRTAVSLSICYGEQFFLGAAAISYAPIKSDESSEAPVRFLSGWTASAGRFDIPFGLDYQVYTSIARETITMPAAVAGTHGGWNDVGLLNSLTTSIGSLDVYAVKGFESRVWNSEQPLPQVVADDDEGWFVSTPSVSGGARLNFAVIPGVEFGGSAARGWQDGRPAHSLGGIHAQFTSSVLSVKAEGIYLRKGESIKPQHVRGFYAETKETLGKVYLIQRFDFADPQTDPTARYAVLGAGVHINEYLVCRGESRTDITTGNPKFFLQVAAGF
jgi:hypothetical protein